MRLWKIAVVAGYVILAPPIATGCGEEAQSKDTETQATDPAVPVEAVTTSAGDISAFFSGTASLEAEDEALVVAKEAGIVTKVLTEEGRYVEKGQPLVKLDAERLTLDMQRAEVAFLKAKREFERKDEMHSKQIISTEEYEQARSEYDAQKANLDLTKLSVSNTTVLAPISGIVSERMVKIGNMVQASSPVFRITDFSPLLAVMHVPERELNKIQTGQKAVITADALPTSQFEGVVVRISPIVDRATGTFKVTIEIADKTKLLKPGMFGRVTILYETHSNAVLVPKSAVLYDGDYAGVFVVADSIAIRRAVTVGLVDERSSEIVSGLGIGEKVITLGQNNLRDSSRVEVIQ